MFKKERFLILLIALEIISSRAESADYTTSLTGSSILLSDTDTVDVTGSSPAISVTTGGVGLKITGGPVIKYTSLTINSGSGIRGAAGTALQLGDGTRIQVTDASDGIYYTGNSTTAGSTLITGNNINLSLNSQGKNTSSNAYGMRIHSVTVELSGENSFSTIISGGKTSANTIVVTDGAFKADQITIYAQDAGNGADGISPLRSTIDLGTGSFITAVSPAYASHGVYMGESSAFTAKKMTIQARGGALESAGVFSLAPPSAPSSLQLDDSIISVTESRDYSYGIAASNTAVTLNSVDISVGGKKTTVGLYTDENTAAQLKNTNITAVSDTGKSYGLVVLGPSSVNLAGDTEISAVTAINAEGSSRGTPAVTGAGKMLIKGSILSFTGADVNLDMTEGSVFTGDTQYDTGVSSLQLGITGSGSKWIMTQNSNLSNLTLSNEAAVYLSDEKKLTGRQILTIDENYHGNGGKFIFNGILADDASPIDQVIIHGNATGTTKVAVNNLGGLGEKTIDGIRIIEVDGTSAKDTFVQEGRIAAGAYDYFLTKGDERGNNINNWYLTNKLIPPPDDTDPPVDPPSDEPADTAGVYRPEFGSYLANYNAVNTLFIHNLYDRLGDAQYTDLLSENDSVGSIWIRDVGRYNKFRDESKQLNTYGKAFTVQIGGDIARWSTDGMNRYHLGIMGGYGFNHNSTNSKITDYKSKGEATGYNLGIYGTWFSNSEDRSGFYLDSWLMYSWFDNTIEGEELEKEKYTSKGMTASIEGGYTFRVGSDSGNKTLFVQPKAQAIYMGIDTKDYTESNGTNVKFSGENNIQTRLGIRVYTSSFNSVEPEKKVFQPFAEAAWIHNQKDFNVEMDGVNNWQSGMKNLGEIKLGTEIKLSRRLDIWGNAAYQRGENNFSDIAVTLGIKYRF